MKFNKLIILKFTFFIAFNNLFLPSKSFSEELNKEVKDYEIKNLNLDNKEKEMQKDIYILGPGDELSIEILNTKIDRDIYGILNDGSLSLPLAGEFYFTGKTIIQAKNEIIERLRKEIIEPSISITLVKPRPISVFVLGEINNPGLYNLSFTSEETYSKITNDFYVGLPTLVSAIKSAGGITQDTNLKNVELVRLLPGNNNEYKKTELNLLDLIFEGQIQNNPYLFDGDIIKFTKANKDYPQNKNAITSNNLTPDFIEVTVIGEVKVPGVINVSKNTSLFQSILKAGGPVNSRYSTSNAELFRINRNGSASYKKYKIDFRKGSSPDNPILRNGDVVRVKRNLLAKSSDTLGQVTQPLRDVITIYSLFKIFD